jgi:hypothetical protein
MSDKKQYIDLFIAEKNRKEITEQDLTNVSSFDVKDEKTFIEFLKNLYVSKVLDEKGIKNYTWSSDKLVDFLQQTLSGYEAYHGRHGIKKDDKNVWRYIAEILAVGSVWE